MKKVVIINLILVLAVLVFSSYLFQKFTKDPIIKAWGVLRPDKRLGWIQKSELNHHDFANSSISTNSLGFRNGPEVTFENSSTFVFGPSSAFGWGVDNTQTFSSLLTQGGEKTYNLSVIGFSVFQGQLLLNSLPKEVLQKKHWVVAYGINDLDYFRFYDRHNFSDEVFFSRNRIYGFIEDITARSNLLFLALRIYLDFPFYAQCRIASDLKTRVPINKFVEHLQNFYTLAKQLQSRITIVNTAYRLPVSYQNKTNTLPDYTKSIFLAKNGKCTDAFNNFVNQKVHEPFRIQRDVKVLNAITESFAEANSLTYIHADLLLSDAIHFVDPVHPSSIGHRRLADEIKKRLRP